MKPEEEKARRDWVRSMHLRPVHIVDGNADSSIVYIAIGYAPGHKQKTELRLVPVDRNRCYVAVTYKNRGTLFPWDDLDVASDILFKTEVAKRREQLLKEYGELRE